MTKLANLTLIFVLMAKFFTLELYAQDLNHKFTATDTKKFFVYVAPWCSACKSLQPVLNAWCKKSAANNVEFVIVIGAENKPGENERALPEYGSCNTFIDQSGEVAKKYAVQSYPSFRQINKKMERLGTSDQDTVNELSKLIPLSTNDVQK